MLKKLFTPLLIIISKAFEKKPVLTLDQIQKLHGYDTVIPYSDCVFSPEENIALAKKNGEKFLIDATNGRVMHDEKHYEIEEKVSC